MAKLYVDPEGKTWQFNTTLMPKGHKLRFPDLTIKDGTCQKKAIYLCDCARVTCRAHWSVIHKCCDYCVTKSPVYKPIVWKQMWLRIRDYFRAQEEQKDPQVCQL